MVFSVTERISHWLNHFSSEPAACLAASSSFSRDSTALEMSIESSIVFLFSAMPPIIGVHGSSSWNPCNDEAMSEPVQVGYPDENSPTGFGAIKTINPKALDDYLSRGFVRVGANPEEAEEASEEVVD